MKSDFPRVGVQLDRAIHERMRAFADREGRKVTWVIDTAVREWLDAQEAPEEE